MVLGNRKRIQAQLKGCYLGVQYSVVLMQIKKNLYSVPLKITPPKHILFLGC